MTHQVNNPQLNDLEQLKYAYQQAKVYARELTGEIAERRRKEAELQQRAAQLALINDIGRQIAAVLDLDEVLDRAVRLVQETFDYHHVAIFFVEDNQLRLKAVAGSYKEHFPPGHTQQLNQGLNGWVAIHGTVAVANDTSAESRYISLIPEHSITQAELCLPITVAGRTIGVLDIQSAQPGVFARPDIVAMEALTNQIAVAIENARLYEAVQQELGERKRAELALKQAHAELEQRVEERTAALRESEERYRDLFENAHDLIQSLNPNGSFGYVNRRWLEAMGYTEEEVAGLRFEAILEPGQIPLWKDIFRQLKQGRSFINQRLVFVTRWGRNLVVEGNLTPYFTGDTFVACRAILRDITEREQVAEALATRLRYERALSVCSYVLLTNIETEEALTETLHVLLGPTGVSRIYICENFEEAGNGLCMRQIHQARAHGFDPPEEPPFVPYRPYQNGFRRWQTALMRGQPVSGRVDTFPEPEREILEPQGILSTLILPIWVDGKLYGFIGFDDAQQPRSWGQEDIQLLQTAAGMIGAYIERKRVEKALRESEAKYRTLIEQSSDAVYLIYGGRFEVINRRFEELFGVTQAMANSPDFTFTNIISPKSRKAFKELVKHNPQGRDLRSEFTALDKDGNQIEIELSVSYPRYRDGLATQGIIRDITERKRMEEEKQRAYRQVRQYADELAHKIKEEHRQREIANILAEVVASVSLTLSTDELLDHILLKLQQLIPYDSASIFLKEDDHLVIEAARGFEVSVISQQHQLESDLLFHEMQAKKSYILIEDTARDARYKPWLGAEKIRSWVGAPLLVAQEIIGYLAVDRHVPGAFTTADAELVQAFAHQVAQTIHNARLFADLKNAQAQLIQRERLAALGQMAATVAHELRNPLMGIRMGVDYLVRGVSETDPRHRGATLMQANIDRIDRIVEDILYVARAPQPNLAPGLLKSLITDELSRWELRLAQQQIHWHTSLADNLPPVLLDPDQMARVFSNLISNSIDVLPPGGKIEISLSQSDRGQVITFADNGPGISPEHLPRVFEPFFTTKSRGTGLGLGIVKQIIEYHQGEIGIWSEAGKGTRFTITLPSME